MKVNYIDTMNLKYIINDNKTGYKINENFTTEKSKVVKKFHNSIKDYKGTELVELKNLSSFLNVKSIFVKDESTRFNLEAFKVLGGSYSVAKLICQKLQIDINDISFDYLKSKEVKEKLGDITFATATDGNHGRGIAWTAKELGYKAVIYLPKGTAKRRIEHIENLGAEAILTNLNYDDAVRLAFKVASEKGWYVVQDTAWDGYMEIPTWIMEGYLTMCSEACEQITERPTHVFLQAGVGAMAGAVQGYLAAKYKESMPKTIILEPLEAACIFKSAEINDGQAKRVEGDLSTIMAGLACGDANPIGWEIMSDNSYAFAACDNYMSADGVRILANPIDNDKKIIAGESGSVGIGFLYHLSKTSELEILKKTLGIDENSIILIFNTEGATDPINYRDILWLGKYSK